MSYGVDPAHLEYQQYLYREPSWLPPPNDRLNITAHKFWLYKAKLADDFCTGACDNSDIYQTATSEQRRHYAQTCRAYKTYMRVNGETYDASTGVPQTDCYDKGPDLSTVKFGISEPADGSTDNKAYAEFWCGTLSMYMLVADWELDPSTSREHYGSFQSFLCSGQWMTGPFEFTSGLNGEIPRWRYGELEMAPELARVLWSTYLSVMQKHDNWTWNDGLDAAPVTGLPRALTSCHPTGHGTHYWNPPWWNGSMIALAIGKPVTESAGYHKSFIPIIADTVWSHCVQPGWTGGVYNRVGSVPISVSGSYVRNTVDAWIEEKRLQRRRSDTRTDLSGKLPTTAEIAAERAAGAKKRVLRSVSEEKQRASMLGAYEVARESGTPDRPYRDTMTFGSRIAKTKCPDLKVATGMGGCYCESYLSDCASAQTKYGLRGNASIVERTAFRYCARAWDAFGHAPTPADRDTAKALLCVLSPEISATERLGAVLRGTMEPQPGFGPDSRILDGTAMLVPEVPTLVAYARRAFNGTAIRSGISGISGMFGRAYSGSWIERALVDGRRAAVNSPYASAETKLEWTVNTLRGAAASLEPTTVKPRLSQEQMAQLPRWKRVDEEGRSLFVKPLHRMIAIAERELRRVRGDATVADSDPLGPTADAVLEAVGVPKGAMVYAHVFAAAVAGFRRSVTAPAATAGDPSRATPGGAGDKAVTGRALAKGAPAVAGPGWLRMDLTPPDRPVTESVLSIFRTAVDGVGSRYEPLISALSSRLRSELGLPNATVAAPLGITTDAELTNIDLTALNGFIRDFFQDLANTTQIENAMTDFGDYLLRVITCVYPLQVNTTLPYNIFCLPRLPEGLMWSTPEGPYYPSQIDWGTELIAENCTNPDYHDRGPYTYPGYPDQTLYGRYWSMHQNPCDLSDGYDRPGCPGSPWCPRVHAPEDIHLDIVDSGIMLLDKLAGLIYRVLYPDIGNGADSVDRIHWLLNFAVLIFLPPLIVRFIPFMAGLDIFVTYAAWAIAVWYSWASGILIHGLIAFFVWLVGTTIHKVLYWSIFAPFFIYGGFWWAYPDLVSWTASAVCGVTDTGMTWMVPLAEEMCYRLNRIALYGSTDAYTNLWLLYFGKTAICLFAFYLSFQLVFWVAVSLFVQAFQLVVALYIIVRVELSRRKVDRLKNDMVRGLARVRMQVMTAQAVDVRPKRL
jgi:hypothetical protein